MGSMSRDNDVKADAIAAALVDALRAIGLDVVAESCDAGHHVGLSIGYGELRTASRIRLPSVSDKNHFSTVLPGWEPPTND